MRGRLGIHRGVLFFFIIAVYSHWKTFWRQVLSGFPIRKVAAGWGLCTEAGGSSETDDSIAVPTWELRLAWPGRAAGDGERWADSRYVLELEWTEVAGAWVWIKGKREIKVMIRFIFGTVTRRVVVSGERMKARQGLVIFGGGLVMVQKARF